MKDDGTRDPALVHNALEACDVIAGYIRGISRATFLARDNKESQVIRDGVGMQVMHLGETCKKLSPEFKKYHSSVHWNELIGLRRTFAHAYLSADWEEVWDAAKRLAPELARRIRSVDMNKKRPRQLDKEIAAALYRRKSTSTSRKK
jgi:uncharacterized protein with HEPN domain